MNSTNNLKNHHDPRPISRFRSLQLHGALNSLQRAVSIIEDWLFDWRYGTDTVTRVYQIELDFDHPSKASAHAYFPTRGRAFKKLISSIAFPKDSVFVDYGSGKGKVLLLASQFGFSRVVGIEYSPLLHDVAVANIQRFKTLALSTIEPVCSDATEYVLQDDENVFYFYDPFELDVLQGVLRQIKASLNRKRRKLWVIYFDPNFKGAFERELGMTQIHVLTYGNYDMVVLTNDELE